MNKIPIDRHLKALCLGAIGLGLVGTTCAVPAIAASSKAAHRVPTGKDSFLIYKVYSVDQLIDEANTQPLVRNRFSRHFRVPESKIISYMRANLVESYIPATGMYTVYNVRKNGTMYPMKQHFKVGTKVFALRNGQPVMKWVCGNPLSKFLPPTRTKTIINYIPDRHVTTGTDTTTVADTFDVTVPSEISEFAIQPGAPGELGVVPGSVPVIIATGGWPAGDLLYLIPPVIALIQSGSSNGSTSSTSTNSTTSNSGVISGIGSTNSSTSSSSTTTNNSGPTTSSSSNTTTSNSGPTTSTNTSTSTSTNTSTNTSTSSSSSSTTTGPDTTSSSTTTSTSSSSATSSTTTTSTGSPVPEPGAESSYVGAILLAGLVVGRYAIGRVSVRSRRRKA